MKTPAHPPPHSQAIEKPSIWGIFALPEIDEILDDRIVLIGDAACVPVYASIAQASLEHRLKWIWEWDTKGELEKVLATL